jgi:hypothetical protein
MEGKVLLRSLFYRKGNDVWELRYFGRTVVFHERVDMTFYNLRQQMIDMVKFSVNPPYPWQCTALVKEGPKSMVVYRP